ncbi:MAG: tautomerase family protein [Verrucomicrobiae bacterium]|nr:tautomerase family protein [Verrucomicrobiae bacterium]
MPYLSVTTTKAIGGWHAKEFLHAASKLVAERLEKPESVVMTAIQQPQVMSLGGNDAPCAMIELSILAIDDSRIHDLYGALHAMAVQHLGLPGDRIFINFHDIPRGRWGCNGQVF